MFGRKTKKMLAMLCIAIMIFATLGENAMVVMAAGDSNQVLVQETSEETEEATDSVEVSESEDVVVEIPASEVITEELVQENIVPEEEIEDEVQTVTAADYTLENGVLTIHANVTSLTAVDAQKIGSFSKLTFEEGSKLTYVGTKAFIECAYITEIDFSNCSQLTDIEAEAFKKCISLSKVTFSKSLQTIADNAFYGCTSLTEVTLTEGLTSISSGAFIGCTSLYKVVVKANNISCVKSTNIFKDCALSDIQFASNNTVVPSGLFCGATFQEGVTVTIPNYIQEIGENAFKSSNLQNIIFEDTTQKPSALSSIANGAFSTCQNLREINFPKSLKTIENSAFYKCILLTSITIPNTVTSLGSSAFEECTEMTSLTLSNAVTNFGSNIFANCSSLTSVEIPSGSCAIGAGQFLGCVSLENVKIAGTVEQIADKAFYGCLSLTSIVVPDSVTILGKGVFGLCTSLDNPVLPANITSIPQQTFEGCSSLTCFSISDDYIGSSDCLVIPDNITTIGVKAFSYCSSAKNLTIGENVTQIGEMAFAGCSDVVNLNIKTVSLVRCGSGIFEDCYLNKVTFAKGISEIPANLFNRAHFASSKTVTIPNTVTAIGDYAFAGTSTKPNNVSKIAFESGSSLRSIGNYAFNYCTAIESFEIPENVTSIGLSAFAKCIKLTSITIPENVVSIGRKAFSECEVLTTVRYNAIAVTTSNMEIFQECNIHTILIGDRVTIIPAYLFYGAKFSTNQTTQEVVPVEINIPASVKKIGNYSMANIVNLSAVYFEEGSQLEEIGTFAFNSCSALSKCMLPDTVKQIGNGAFQECVSLTSFSMPASLEILGSSAFRGCNQIASYVIPVGVTAIADYTFADNTALTKITFEGDAVTSIGHHAFYNCPKLQEILIPQGVTTIGDYAFSGCSGLKRVKIPFSVTSIGTNAFEGCTNAKFYIVKGSYAESWLRENGFAEQCEQINTITYELYGGTNDARNILGYEVGDSFTFYPATKPGYAFKGWFLEETFETEVKDLTGRTGDFTLYAKWSQSDYNIYYELNGGENDPENPTNYNIDDEIVLKNPTKAGYKFDGWFKEDTFKTRVTKIALGSSGDITLHAKWTAIKYTITFNVNGGTGTIEKVVVEGTESFTLPDIGSVERNGYTLTGWNTKKDGTGTQYDLGAVVSAIGQSTSATMSITLYAQWKGNTYLLCFDANGGVTDAVPREISYNESYGELPVATRDGYKFNGWYTQAVGGTKVSSSTKFTATENVTLYAQWIANNYTVTFDGNGEFSKVSPKTASVVFGQTYGTKLATASREGYIFVGWYTKDNELITADSVVSIPENHTLYARWKSSVTADIPKADYPSGTELFAGTKIMLTTTTPGATIYYTLDGSMPTHSSLRYEDAITIEQNVTIKAIAVMQGYNDSAVAEFTYTVIDESQYWGDIIEEDRSLYEDATKVPNKIWVAGVEDVVYSGTAVTFELRVYDYKTLLTEKVDYTIKYSNNKNAADVNAKKAPTITITAKGNYKGKVTVKFNILPINIETDDFIIDDVYAVANGKLQKPVPVVYYNGKKLGNKKDFTVSYPDSNSGGYLTGGTYRIQVDGKGNYTGTRIVNFVLQEKTLISKAKITVAKSVMYTGSPQKPSVVVKMGSTVLTEGTDYAIEYQNNIAVGTASVVVTGLNSYSGVKRVNFTIKPIATINKTTISFNKTSVPYTGKKIELNKGADPITVNVFYKGQQLALGRDYEIISYSKNKDVGTASVVFAGLGGYSGTVKKTFKIVAANMNATKVNLLDESGKTISADASYAFAKGGTKPNMLITYLGKDLTAGKDYTVSYKNNKKIGSASMIIKGKKNFKGSVTVTFTIKQQDLSNMNLQLQDVIYQEAADIYRIKPVLKDLDGKALKAGTDYNSSFKYVYAKDCYVKNNKKSVFRKAGSAIESGDILPVDTVIGITITGKGNYVNDISGQYRIVKSSIAKAKVTVKQQVYTGVAVKPGKEDIIVKVGNTTLSKNDYEIISYSNNVNKGTATVTLKGTGNYGGVITVKYKIVQRTFFNWFK